MEFGRIFIYQYFCGDYFKTKGLFPASYQTDPARL